MSSLLPGAFTPLNAHVSPFILIGLVLLLAVQYELAQYLSGEQVQRLKSILLVSMIPLLIAFSMIIVEKIVQILSTP